MSAQTSVEQRVDTRTLIGRRARPMTVMKSDCQPVSAADGFGCRTDYEREVT